MRRQLSSGPTGVPAGRSRRCASVGPPCVKRWSGRGALVHFRCRLSRAVPCGPQYGEAPPSMGGAGGEGSEEGARGGQGATGVARAGLGRDVGTGAASVPRGGFLRVLVTRHPRRTVWCVVAGGVRGPVDAGWPDHDPDRVWVPVLDVPDDLSVAPDRPMRMLDERLHARGSPCGAGGRCQLQHPRLRGMVAGPSGVHRDHRRSRYHPAPDRCRRTRTAPTHSPFASPTSGHSGVCGLSRRCYDAIRDPSRAEMTRAEGAYR